MSLGTLLTVGGLIVIGAIVTVVVIFVTKKGPEKDGKDNKDENKPKTGIPMGKPIVFQENLPKNFSIGPIITNGVYESANLCDPTKLFPMKDVYVEYDKEGQIPDGSKCLEYLQAP